MDFLMENRVNSKVWEIHPRGKERVWRENEARHYRKGVVEREREREREKERERAEEG
jgi:hypothetical protein